MEQMRVHTDLQQNRGNVRLHGTMAYYKHTASCILEGSLSVIRRSFTSDNNYSQCCIYPAYISINIKTPFITNDHQIICA